MAWTADHSLGRTLKQYQQEYARAMAIELGNVAGQAKYLIAADARALVETVSKQMVGGIAQSLLLFNESLSKEMLSNQEEKVYQMAAEAGHMTMVAQYNKTRKQSGLSYRGGDPANDKRYTGVLGELLASPEAFFSVNTKGVNFIPKDTLYRNAPQWYRLNFGAGPIGTPSAPIVNIPYFGEKIPGPDLKAYRRAPGFMIPAGVWSDTLSPTSAAFFGSGGVGGGKLAFYPIHLASSKTKKALSERGKSSNTRATGQTMSKGIVGGRFFESGINEFNRKLGWGMEALTEKWIKDSASAAKTGSRRAPAQSMSVISSQSTALSSKAVSLSNKTAQKYKASVLAAIAANSR